jgi:two-component system sensor histidine kinase/response regulator
MQIRRFLSDTSLATRAALLVSSIFIVAFGISAFYSSTIFEKNYIELASQSQMTMLRNQADNLNRKLMAAHSILINAAKNIDQEMLKDEARSRHFLESRTFLQQNFDQGLRLFNPQGHAITASPLATEKTSLTPAEKSNVINAISTGLPQISSPFSIVSTSTQTLIGMNAPIYSKDQKLIGVMQGVFNLLSKNFAQDLMAMKVGKTGYSYMTTRGRIMLMHPDQSRHLRLATAPEKILVLIVPSMRNMLV